MLAISGMPPGQYDCPRCHCSIAFPTSWDWGRVSRLVDDHWRSCQASTGASGSGASLASPPRASATLELPDTPRSTTEGTSGTDAEAELSERPRKRQKNTMNESARKKQLEDDPWTEDVTPTSVSCGACHREIRLDKRSRFYPGLWNKHRAKCMEIQRLEALSHAAQAEDDKDELGTKRKLRPPISASSSDIGRQGSPSPGVHEPHPGTSASIGRLDPGYLPVDSPNASRSGSSGAEESRPGYRQRQHSRPAEKGVREHSSSREFDNGSAKSPS
ncbi:hypothetical protein HGRIS_004587 [Hohenbuehelia grisea]|uniref:Uncharacterized protein n=1 Tax=Hohenbuehelia grisea TaxID=104357 RepID=A0ABR3JCR9_9AGAR